MFQIKPAVAKGHSSVLRPPMRDINYEITLGSVFVCLEPLFKIYYVLCGNSGPVEASYVNGAGAFLLSRLPSPK